MGLVVLAALAATTRLASVGGCVGSSPAGATGDGAGDGARDGATVGLGPGAGGVPEGVCVGDCDGMDVAGAVLLVKKLRNLAKSTLPNPERVQGE